MGIKVPHPGVQLVRQVDLNRKALVLEPMVLSTRPWMRVKDYHLGPYECNKNGKNTYMVLNEYTMYYYKEVNCTFTNQEINEIRSHLCTKQWITVNLTTCMYTYWQCCQLWTLNTSNNLWTIHILQLQWTLVIKNTDITK